jgi:hypothetical protein
VYRAQNNAVAAHLEDFFIFALRVQTDKFSFGFSAPVWQTPSHDYAYQLRKSCLIDLLSFLRPINGDALTLFFLCNTGSNLLIYKKLHSAIFQAKRTRQRNFLCRVRQILICCRLRL